MFKRIGLILAAVLLGLSLGCSSSPDAASTADAIYFGGPIITVNDSQPTTEAFAVKDGKILMVGSRADLEKNHKGSSTAMIDLGGKTVIPGFVDGHSHFSLIGRQAISAQPVHDSQPQTRLVTDGGRQCGSQPAGSKAVCWGRKRPQV